MEYYNTFMKVLVKEVAKFKLDVEIFPTYVNELTAELCENFDIPYNRCAYMFRYATVNTYFFKFCIQKFLSDYSDPNDLLSTWKTSSEVKVCSLSIGPGLDFLGFMLAVLQYDPTPPNFDIKVVSKHGAWRNTVSLLGEVLNELGSAFEVQCANLKYENVKVIQANLLNSYSVGIDVVAVNQANVILMMRTLNLLASGTVQEGPWLHALKVLFSSLQPETIIFCIDTKPSIAVLIQALSNFNGKFLYGPIHQSVQLSDIFPEYCGRLPTASARGAFFVWKKSADYDPNTVDLDLLPIEADSNIDIDSLPDDNILTPPSNPEKSNDSSIITNDIQMSDNTNLPLKQIISHENVSSDISAKEIKSDQINVCQLNYKETLAADNVKMSKEGDILSQLLLKLTHSIPPDNSEDLKEASISSKPQQQNFIVEGSQNMYNSYNFQDMLGERSSGGSFERSAVSPKIFNNGSSTASENFNSIKGQNTGAIPKNKNPLSNRMLSKNDSAKAHAKESREIQTDAFQAVSSTSSSVKALTEQIKQLAISIESASQPNDSANHGDTCNSGIFNPENCHNKMPHSSYNNASCSKQTPNCCMNGQKNFPDYNSRMNACLHCTSCYCRYSHSHYDCMRGCFQHCCAQFIPRCNFYCNSETSIGHNLGCYTQPTIVIPLQNINEEKLSKIISVLKS